MHNRCFVVAALGAVSLVAVARADIIGSYAVTLSATDGVHSGSWNVPIGGLNQVGPNIWMWNGDYSSAPINIVSSDASHTVLGQVSGMGVLYNGDPVISLGFSVFAGAATTTFNISSALMTIPTDLYTAQGSAGVTLTDTFGNGSTFAGLFPGGFGYEAYCNGNVIADLVPGFSTTTTVTQSGAFGPFNVIASSMRAAFSFQLTPFDSASGTSTYRKDLVPTPGTVTLMGIAGVTAMRRRHRRA